MITGDGKPGNVNTNEFDLNNGGWILIAILICIIVLLTVILIINCYKLNKKTIFLQSLSHENISNEEIKLLSAYRNLNDRDKAIIQNTLKTLNDQDKQQKE